MPSSSASSGGGPLAEALPKARVEKKMIRRFTMVVSVNVWVLALGVGMKTPPPSVAKFSRQFISLISYVVMPNVMGAIGKVMDAIVQHYLCEEIPPRQHLEGVSSLSLSGFISPQRNSLLSSTSVSPSHAPSK